MWMSRIHLQAKEPAPAPTTTTTPWAPDMCMQLLEPTMLETVSCPVRAARTVPKVTLIKTGKETKVLCFFSHCFLFFSSAF